MVFDNASASFCDKTGVFGNAGASASDIKAREQEVVNAMSGFLDFAPKGLIKCVLGFVMTSQTNLALRKMGMKVRKHKIDARANEVHYIISWDRESQNGH